MAGLTLKAEIEGIEPLKLSFRHLDKTLDDISIFGDVIEKWFFDIETDAFRSAGATNRSGKWADLADGYEEIKYKKYARFLADPLIATERLYKSLRGKTADTIIEKSKDEIAIGTSVPYAKIHQTGGKNLPQRKIIDPSDAQIKDLQKKMKKSLLPYLRKSTLIVTEGSEDVG